MDATFGSGGTVAAPADNGGAFAMVLQPDGNIVAAGNLTSTTYSDFALARYIGTLGSPALPVITVAATDSNAAEAGPDLGVFTLTRSGDTTNALTVNFALEGATPGTDYNNVDTSVTILAGQTSATVTITPIPDTVAEGSETVTLTLASGTGYTVGSPDAATVNIANYSGGLLRGMSSVNFGNVRVGSSADKTLPMATRPRALWWLSTIQALLRPSAL